MNADAKKRYKDIEFPFTCPITNRVFEVPQGLSCYVTKTLKVNHGEYYDKYINHRDSSCFFCGSKGKFISISKGYRNLCDNEDCVKKSFNSHSVEGFMYREMCSREEAESLFKLENERQLNERLKTQHELRKIDPLWDKKRSRNCKEFWIEKGYSEEEAKIKSREVMNEIHGKTSKKLKSNPEKYATKYPTKVEYYLKKGFSVDEAREEISKIQNRFSLEKCIEKYGKIDGESIFKQRQEKWQKSLMDNGNIKGGYSKISQVLFYDIIKIYDKKSINDVFFWTKNKEYFLKSDKSILLYDFTDINKKKIIEFNGDQYHANPSIYEKNDTPHPYHKTKNWCAEKIWEKDNIKIDLAIKNGFDVLTIWESEYKKNPQQTLEKCIKFIHE
jgi:hypothetical protein